MPLKTTCPTTHFQIAASSANTKRPNNERVFNAVRSTNRSPQDPGPSARSATARSRRKLVFASILCIASAGHAQSASAEECKGQILEVVEKTIAMTMLRGDADVPRKEKIKKKGSAMKMPLCVLDIDHKKFRYRVRLPDGGEALLSRRYVLKATDKPPITVNCDGYTVYTDQEGGVRGSGEDPCN